LTKDAKLPGTIKTKRQLIDSVDLKNSLVNILYSNDDKKYFICHSFNLVQTIGKNKVKVSR
jgi:hypothetical protein